MEANRIKTPRLSVVIPAHNPDNSILDAIQSVAGIEPSSEFVVVENGSKALSLEDLQRAAPGCDIKLFELEEADLSSARNFGMHQATGEFVLFLDADDFLIGHGGLFTDACLAAEEVGVIALPMKTWRTKISTSARSHHGGLQTAPNSSHSSRVTLARNFLIRKLLSHQYSPITGRYVFRRSLISRSNAKFREGVIHEDHFPVFHIISSSQYCEEVSSPVLVKRVHANSITGRFGFGSSKRSLEGYRRARADIESRATIPEATESLLSAKELLLARLDAIIARGSLYQAVRDHEVKHLGKRTLALLRSGISYFRVWVSVGLRHLRHFQPITANRATALPAKGAEVETSITHWTR